MKVDRGYRTMHANVNAMSQQDVSPLEYSIEFDPRGLVFLRLRGHPDIGAADRIMEAVTCDQRFRPGFGLLVDRRGMDLPDRGYTESLLGIIVRCWSRRGGGPWATLCDPGAAFGMARMLDLRAALIGLDVASFTGEEDAVKWLRVRMLKSEWEEDGSGGA